MAVIGLPLLAASTAWAVDQIQPPSVSIELERFYCEQVSSPERLPTLDQCDRTSRPPDQTGLDATRVVQRLRLTTDRPTGVDLKVFPHFINQVSIYRWHGQSWQQLHVGGADHVASQLSNSLGGHRFELSLPQGVSDVLVVMLARNGIPNARISVTADPQRVGMDQTLVAMHLGMLWLLVGLGVLGWVIRKESLQLRLLAVALLSALSVSIGSGAVYLFWPGVSAELVGSIAFNVINVLRLVAMLWLYEAILSPHLGARALPAYRGVNRIGYLLAGVAVLLFVGGQYPLGLGLTLAVFVCALVAPMLGGHWATRMPRTLRWAILASAWSYVALSAVLWALVAWSPHGSEVALWLTRVFDLALPLGLLVVVVLRNRVTDAEFTAAQSVLAAQASMLDSERKAREEKRLLLDMLTHEIKNPLASISFAVSTLSQGRAAVADDSARRFQNIARSVSTIDQIIERCNLANGLEEDRVAPHLEQVSPGVLLHDLVATSFEHSRIDVMQSSVPVVQTDPYLLRVVAANLIDNAVKYATPGSRIEVSLFGPTKPTGLKDRWGFKVCNAIDAQMAPDTSQVFDRYYRHPLAQRLRGSGLGLSLSKEIVQLLNGQLTCQYQPAEAGMGRVCFEVSFYAS